jgi:hypothetical protein
MKSISNAQPGTAGFNLEGKLYDSRALVDVARAQVGNKLLLGFSGKDSLAAWLFLREQGFEIVPYMLYTVPGMKIDLEARAYYEDFFQTKIYYLPHPYFYTMLRNMEWQIPHQAATLKRLDMADFDFAGIEGLLAEENGLDPDNYFSVVGYLASDNLGRNSFINRSGTLGLKHRRYYFAIWDWHYADVMGIIDRSKCRLPRHYRIWGNTGTGRPFEYTGLKRLREHVPEDYQRVLKYFPFLDLEMFRYEVVSKWHQ